MGILAAQKGRTFDSKVQEKETENAQEAVGGVLDHGHWVRLHNIRKRFFFVS
jgi:hypothetical protein